MTYHRQHKKLSKSCFEKFKTFVIKLYRIDRFKK